jgi:hypothetical protein
MTQTGNPIIRHLFTADPAVIEYNGTVYLYTAHDETPLGVQEYDMHDWQCFCSPWAEYPATSACRGALLSTRRQRDQDHLSAEGRSI